MPRRLPLAAALALAAAVATTPLTLPKPAAAADPLSAEQKDAVEKLVHDYLLNHPEVLIEALQAAEQKQQQLSMEQAQKAMKDRREELLADPAAPVLGNPKGDVTIVEFFDYRCPYCKQMHAGIQALLGEDKKLRFVAKEFPVLGKDSVTASRAALAAQKQGKYEPFHNALLATKGQLNEDAVMKAASSVGLDVDRLKEDMKSPDIETALKHNYALAQALDIRGTPAFVIGNELIPGAVDAATIKEKVAAARKSG
ncbi:MAG TPA: DsbA family protein [Stellaceae bacterium]